MNTEKDNCCKTTYQFFKIKDNHLGETGFLGLTKAFTDVELNYPLVSLTPAVKKAHSVAYYSNPPPFNNGIPLYILDCVYRI